MESEQGGAPAEQTNVEGDQNIVQNPPAEGDAPQGEPQPGEVPAGGDEQPSGDSD